MDWFTSDTHFNHHNIIKYQNRPYDNVNHMNESLINNWNKRVLPQDNVFHLGDFALGNVEDGQHIMNRLNGKKHLIIGNHEKVGESLTGWEWVKHYHEGVVNSTRIVMCHYAMRVWNQSHKGAWMLYGHSHNSLPDDHNALSIDVGVDCHNYRPLSFQEVKFIMKKKKWNPVDHHNK